MADFVGAIDQGTTSTRFMVFDHSGAEVARHQLEHTQIMPQPGWVEHNPIEIWERTCAVIMTVLNVKNLRPSDLAALGLTNQRETTLVWNRRTGRPYGHAIVWQDTRTDRIAAALDRDGRGDVIRHKAGLPPATYFAGGKLQWMLDNFDGLRADAERGDALFGTVDSWLLWNLTGGVRGGVHATDVTNAARTQLYDIHRQCWDEELLAIFNVPRALLPEVRDSSGHFGSTEAALFGRALPIAGIAGDQQAALIGQACFAPGMAKSTYGTGCFLLLNTGDSPVASANRMLTTPAYRLGGRMTYAMEGSIFVAGAAIKWLRDGLRVIGDAAATAALAASVPADHGVYLVPAFVGLGAPHWNPRARGLLCGLTLDATPAHLARAALESIAYQTLDLTTAMERDGAQRAAAIRVDGGVAANDWFCQFLADILDARVERPGQLETTALGAAFLAGLATGVWRDLGEVAATWSAAAAFSPAMAPAQRARLLAGWQQALQRCLF